MVTTRTTTVRDIMTRDPICVDAAATIRELASILVRNGISGVPVVGANGKLVGVASKSDLVRRCVEGEQGRDPHYLFSVISEPDAYTMRAEPLILVGDFMSTDPVTACPDESVADVAHRMAEQGVHRLIIVDEELQPIGIVTTLDVLRAFPDGTRKR
ncbi:MAG: CBS domain-containing protein [Planctomycetota bacterium]|nr:MAG: CBS domain-containing protein [Planctomycetota bacterium]